MRSPRQHIAGEAPPELSPLDAFALQSRLLARQLGESNPRTGRRMSRLPPLDASSPLIVQARRDYFRSLSNDSASSDRSIRGEQHSDGLGLKTEVEDAFGDDRPVSVHPRMSGIPAPPPVADDVPVPELPPNLVFDKAPTDDKDETETPDFSSRFEGSPTPMDEPAPVVEAISTDDAVHIPPSQVATATSPTLSNNTPEISSAEQFQGHGEAQDSPGLAPPRPPFQKRPSSSIASSFETTDEEGTTPMTSSFNSLPLRKMSSGSQTSGLHPSPGPAHSKQSPSIGSEHSAVPRPFNFSRPISRVGTPGPESPYMKAAHDSYFPLVEADESAVTPRSVNSDSHENEGTPGAQSYIYSKFTLPRGKAVRPSLQPGDQVLNMWHQANSPSMLRGAPPSPPVRSPSSSSRDVATEFNMVGTSPDQANDVGPAPQPSPNPSIPSIEEGRPSEDAPRGRTMTSRNHEEARAKTAQSTSTQDSSSTVKPTHKPTITPTSILEMSAEEHLAKGIECHENGSLSKSTYHLRLAARQHNPTAMLLYALACRHGWGMRVNEKEGVEWLRKAAEYASLRKAQFALSIYELGVSHMNGWGIEQDRGLALRCFEIAGCRFIPACLCGVDQVLTVGSVGRCGCAFRGGLLLRPGHRVQEGSEEGGQVLPDCRV